MRVCGKYSILYTSNVGQYTIYTYARMNASRSSRTPALKLKSYDISTISAAGISIQVKDNLLQSYIYIPECGVSDGEIVQIVKHQ